MPTVVPVSYDNSGGDSAMEASQRSSSGSVVLDLRPRAATRDTVVGRTREWDDLQPEEIAFLVISFISILGTVGLTITKLVQGVTGDDFTFALILLINTALCSYYILHGVLRERPYEIIVYVIACVIVIVYIIANFASSSNNVKDKVKLARLICASILGPVNIVLGIVISIRYHKSGNLIFRTVGANETLQKICKTMYFASGLLKFDFQLEVSMVLLILQNGREIGLKEQIVLGVGFPLSVLWLIMGFLSMRFENKIMTLVFLISGVFEPAYIIWKIYDSSGTITERASKSIEAVTFACAALALIVRITLLFTMVFVYRNYGKGLKEKAYGRSDYDEYDSQRRRVSTEKSDRF
ncbi:uncharacterized protein LOC141908853 isoform X2 [Tubulanus polymorphus]|uniref:uncharacterized protein LOC141908853 isoform X2 n=1 Tax=Tubulanus polymorphus TaxID=672921 RepID=UPI003DA4A5C4